MCFQVVLPLILTRITRITRIWSLQCNVKYIAFHLQDLIAAQAAESKEAMTELQQHLDSQYEETADFIADLSQKNGAFVLERFCACPIVACWVIFSWQERSKEEAFSLALNFFLCLLACRGC